MAEKAREPKEIASLTWVTDAEGNTADEIALTDDTSKGDGGGRTIPMHPAIREALVALNTISSAL